MRRGPEMPMLMHRIGRSIAGSKASVRGAEACRLKSAQLDVSVNSLLDDYSPEAERQIRKIIGGGLINLR
jgi:hypothetical protein